MSHPSDSLAVWATWLYINIRSCNFLCKWRNPTGRGGWVPGSPTMHHFKTAFKEIIRAAEDSIVLPFPSFPRFFSFPPLSFPALLHSQFLRLLSMLFYFFGGACISNEAPLMDFLETRTLIENTDYVEWVNCSVNNVCGGVSVDYCVVKYRTTHMSNTLTCRIKGSVYKLLIAHLCKS